MKSYFHLRLLLLLIIVTVSTVNGQDSQQTMMDRPKEADSIRHKHAIVPGLIVTEAFLIGMSYYAAKPQAHGDEVVGWLYAGSSAALLVYLPFYWTDKDFNKEDYFKEERIWGSVALLGISYGFSRIATYNLLQSDGDTYRTRFNRNLIETHAAYIVPIVTTALVKSLMHKKKNKGKVETSFMFDGRTFSLAMRF